MWISDRVADWVSDLKKDADKQAEVAQQALIDLKEELSATRAERDALRIQIATTNTNFDWLRMQWNQMQAENKVLLERAYGVRVPVPEMVRRAEPNLFNLQDLFSHIEDSGETAS